MNYAPTQKKKKRTIAITCNQGIMIVIIATNLEETLHQYGIKELWYQQI